jgi:hypothetical protein
MSSNDNNLLSFLKKNSLFTNSPTKNGTRKSKSRSKDKNNEIKVSSTKNREQLFDDGYKNKQLAPLETNFNNQLDSSQPNRGFTPLQTNNMKLANESNDSRFYAFDDLEERSNLKFAT